MESFMKVDLIVPEFPPAHWNFAFAMDVEGSKYSHPPLGAATLASYTPRDAKVRIFDENVAPIDFGSLADTVGISAMYIQRKRAFELAKKLRAEGKRVLLGGGLVAGLPQACAEAADIVFHGEAELTWPKFIEDLAEGAPKDRYDAPERFDMNTSRMPRYDLLQMSAYSTASLQTSRGCPYSCDYCDVPKIDGSRPRTKPIGLVMEEIERLYAGGQRSFFIVDDHFLGNRKYALQVVAEIQRFVERNRHKPIFYCQATLNVASDEEALEALYRANFRRLFIGIESDDLGALKNVRKHQNTQLPVAEAVKRIQRWNITVWAALLAGFDEDTPETFRRYARFTRDAGIGMIIPGLLQAVPGTAYHDRMTAEQRLVPLRNGYVAGQAGSLDSLLMTNVKPRNMSNDELLSGYRRFVRELYEYDAFGDRVVGFLEAGTKPELGKADLSDVWAARNILRRALRHYLLGDADRRRFAVRIFRYLLRTKMRRVDEAIFHLVIYKHLREFYFTASDASVPLADDLVGEAAA
jgi:radical SAM superfamily enzyme YgiQ (UPF0313 family)